MSRRRASTARSSVFLRNVKRQMNTKIYKRVLQLENEDGRGPALSYLGQFFNEESRERCLRGFLGQHAGAGFVDPMPEAEYRKYRADADARARR